MAFPDYAPSVPVFLRQVAARFGEKELIVLGERRLTYAAAERESARLARGLLAAGAGKGTRIALLQPNGPDWVLGWLAAARIGALVVPLNTFYAGRELGWVLRHADVHTLLTVARFLKHDYLERLETIAPELRAAKGEPLCLRRLPYLRAVRVWGAHDRGWASDGPEVLGALADAHPELDADHLAAVEACVTPADPMVLIYSSGSTAEPKGAVHSHGAVIRHAHNLNPFRDLLPEDRVYTPMPFFWVGGFAFGLVSAMHLGATLICEELFEPGRTLELIERERVSVVAAWPHYAKALAEHPSFRSRDLSCVRAGNLYDLLPANRRPRDPELRFNSLGMTETCGPHTVDRTDVDLPEALRGSFGRSVPGLEHKIVDPASGAALPPGELGEICIRGYSVMQGLYKQEREETFDRDGFYHSGDAGWLDADGHLFFKGRLREMIKTGGANVAPREVEVVLESFPEVKHAYVVGVPEPARGQDVAAVIVAKDGAPPVPEALRERARVELSAYKVPRHWLFAAAGELPFTDSGKIDKRRLEAWVVARLPGARGQE
jgi:acyl-CoA synthetase (AMP-forming)/AMP-acid ligase II